MMDSDYKCNCCGKKMITGRDCHNNVNLYCEDFPYCDGFVKHGGETR